jgi:hypothetical protein
MAKNGTGNRTYTWPASPATRPAGSTAAQRKRLVTFWDGSIVVLWTERTAQSASRRLMRSKATF